MNTIEDTFRLSDAERIEVLSQAQDWLLDRDPNRASFKDRLEHVRLQELRRKLGVRVVTPKKARN